MSPEKHGKLMRNLTEKALNSKYYWIVWFINHHAPSNLVLAISLFKPLKKLRAEVKYPCYLYTLLKFFNVAHKALHSLATDQLFFLPPFPVTILSKWFMFSLSVIFKSFLLIHFSLHPTCKTNALLSFKINVTISLPCSLLHQELRYL